MIKEAIAKLVDKKNLTQAEASESMTEIMTGQATPSQIAGFLVALRNKGESVEEIAGLALSMRDSATPVVVHPQNMVDCCGTGGDGQSGMNMSTAAALIVAGAGVNVAKHGNRSISSRCGSADVLEQLGVRIDAPVSCVEQSINMAGIGFLFAPQFHPAMKYAMPTRRELGIRTVFNVMGPLTNPAKVKVQLIGVYHAEMAPQLARVMALMGHKAGMVVHSHGWDEITLVGPTQVSEMLNGEIRNYTLTHKDFGLPQAELAELKGSDAKQNANVILEILNGGKSTIRNVVMANAAAVIWIYEKGYQGSKMLLKDAVKVAEESVDSGNALRKLHQLAEISHSLD